MRIVSLKLRGFRNLQEAAFTFSPRVNLVLGRNGEGKTNFLEALNYFSLGRSHRGSKNEELIGFDHEALHVQLEVEEESGNVLPCEFGLDRQGGRRFRLDGEAVRRRADLVGRLATVFFNPDSIQLVRGGPQERRSFVDQGMAEVDPLYLAALTSLQRTLKQKSGLLRKYKLGLTNPAKTEEELRAWNRELATHAAVVCLGRQDYARLLTPHAAESQRALTDQEDDLVFRYRPQLESVRNLLESDRDIPLKKLPEKEHLEGVIYQEIDYIRGSEMKRGRPLSGPQLDDFAVLLNRRFQPPEKGLDLRVYGSQGETRTAAISLILARSDALFARRRIRPVLFFDDIFSELDRERTLRLQELASRLHQVFIATARKEDVDGWHPDEMKIWNVESGALNEVT
nr:DNA replication and repair protein RecF [Candidatus Krumholzibacteria bacterium]